MNRQDNDASRILLLEDDKDAGSETSEFLESFGYVVTYVETAETATKLLEEADFDLLIVDVQLPGVNGFQFVRKLRQSYDMPVIFLSGRVDLVDRVFGLEIGADDYMTKPFDERELLARCDAQLRRHARVSKTKEEEIAPGIRYFPESRSLDISGSEPVVLRPTDATILTSLLKKRGSIVSRDDLSHAAFNREWAFEDRAVDNSILRLRKIFGKEHNIIQSVRGAGYILM